MGKAPLARNRLDEGFLLSEPRTNQGNNGSGKLGESGGGVAMIELIESADPGARIKVIGAGGCGGNAVNHMIASGLRNVDFIVVNTDAQALENNHAPIRIPIGQGITKGRGAGGNPEVGRKAVLEDEDHIREV